MSWTIILLPTVEGWIASLDQAAEDAIYTDLAVLEEVGPQLGRPQVDTLNGSTYSNMKELRTHHVGHQFRIAFIFDPKRRGIVLTGGDKAGANQKRFYATLIKQADRLYAAYLKQLKR